MTFQSQDRTAEDLAREIQAYIERSVARAGGSTRAVCPHDRVPFHWPPHPISYEYRIGVDAWTERAEFHAYGERFEVRVAHTPRGVFGRCEAIWHEERGETLEEMLENLRASSEPLFRRQHATSRALEREGRFTDHISELPPEDLLKLLYCEDRDVALEAQTVIETHASTHLFLPALLAILEDRRHPNRRSAQWAVLDLFEDLPSFCSNPAEERRAIEAMRQILWEAEDDFARTTYKAGVVLGGHVAHKGGAEVLLESLDAPSKIGRRSAIHGLFHVVEWIPESKARVVAAIRDAAERDPEPSLREYARRMAEDIESGDLDHVVEPTFPEELG
jgi:hypothetical protein